MLSFAALQDGTAAQEGDEEQGMTFEQIEISQGIKSVICSAFPWLPGSAHGFLV